MTYALVTGASRGMGWEVTRQLAESGWTVFAGARDPDAVTERSRDVNGAIHAIRLDVTDDDSVARAAAVVRETSSHLDVIVQNAGIAGSWAEPAEITPADFDAVLAVNVLGPVRVTHAFLPLLQASARPRLVFVSSGMGSFSSQTTDPDYAAIAHLPYPASKAALTMLAVQYAKGLPDVLVTAVDPGLTATEFTGGAGHDISVGVAPILNAARDTKGPTGRFMNKDGIAAW